MFLKVTDLAAAIGIDEKTVLGWIKTKGLPAHKALKAIRVTQARREHRELLVHRGQKVIPAIQAQRDRRDYKGDRVNGVLDYFGRKLPAQAGRPCLIPDTLRITQGRLPLRCRYCRW